MKKLVSILLCLVMVFTATFAFAGCGEKKDGTLTKIRVVYHPTIGGSTAVAVADELGYFEEEGLDVTFQMFTAGGPEIAAMAAGQVEFGFIGSGAAWLAFSGNVDIVALDNIALTEEIIVRKGSGIKSIKDLKGKVVAVQDGMAGYTLLLVALKANGMTIDDVKILNIANDNIPSTYNDKTIDCWAVWKPSSTSLMTALGDDGLVLANNATYPEFAFPSVWVANKDYIKANPEVTQKFINALTKGQIWRQAHPEEACAYASIKAGQAANDLTVQLPDVIFPTEESFKNFYTTDAFANMLKNLKEIQSSKVTGALSIDDVLSDQFVKAMYK